MGMNVIVSMFISITRDTICTRISSISGCPALHNREIDQGSNSQDTYSDDTDGRDTLCSGGTPLLLFTPKLGLSTLFLPRSLTSALLAHKSHSSSKHLFAVCNDDAFR